MLAERHLHPRLLDSRIEAITLVVAHPKAMKEVSWNLYLGLMHMDYQYVLCLFI
jgi:hypothetical protein